MRVLSLKKRAKLEALEHCMGRSMEEIEFELFSDSGFSGTLPIAASSLNGAKVIDVLEHVEDDERLLAELHRALKAGGVLCLSVPRSERRLGLNRLRRAIGMTPAVYGHVREGYSVAALRQKLNAAGFSIVSVHTFSGPFTELMEMMLNRFYLVLSGGEISPLRGKRSAASAAALCLYRVAQPLLRLIAMVDRAAFPAQRYGIVVKAVKRA